MGVVQLIQSVPLTRPSDSDVSKGRHLIHYNFMLGDVTGNSVPNVSVHIIIMDKCVIQINTQMFIVVIMHKT